MINAKRDIIVVVFEHLEITSTLSISLSNKYTERVLCCLELENIDRYCCIESIKLGIMLEISGHW